MKKSNVRKTSAKKTRAPRSPKRAAVRQTGPRGKNPSAPLPTGGKARAASPRGRLSNSPSVCSGLPQIYAIPLKASSAHKRSVRPFEPVGVDTSGLFRVGTYVLGLLSGWQSRCARSARLDVLRLIGPSAIAASISRADVIPVEKLRSCPQSSQLFSS
jgi:hypothetical protein